MPIWHLREYLAYRSSQNISFERGVIKKFSDGGDGEVESDDGVDRDVDSDDVYGDVGQVG